MSRPPRLIDYLTHITDAIERIDDYTDGLTEGAYLRDRLVQDATVRNIEIIGEASNNIAKQFPDFAEQNPEIPLSWCYKMRNVVAHDYFKVSFKRVWETIQTDLPELHAQVSAAQAGLANVHDHGLRVPAP